MVFAMGEGSCLDIGKAVARLCTNGRNAWDYVMLENQKFFEVIEKPLFLIVVPTTSGDSH